MEASSTAMLELNQGELRDLAQQLRILFERTLAEEGFVKEDKPHSLHISEPSKWHFKRITDIPGCEYIFHTEQMDGPTLVREAMKRITTEQPRFVTSNYIVLLRTAVKYLTIKMAIDWKREIERYYLNLYGLEKTTNSYVYERILFLLWV